MKKGVFFVPLLIVFFVLFFVLATSLEAEDQTRVTENAGKVKYTVSSPESGELGSVISGQRLAEEPQPEGSIPVERVENYIDNGTEPSQFCARLDAGGSVQNEFKIGEGQTCTLYYLLAEPQSETEALICEIREDPTDTSNISSAPWESVSDVKTFNVIEVDITTSEPFSILDLIVCENGDYTLAGPTGVNQYAPCKFCPDPKAVPTVTHPGMLLLMILLTGSALWVMHRRRKRRA